MPRHYHSGKDGTMEESCTATTAIAETGCGAYSKRLTASGRAEKVGDMTVGALIASLQLFLAGRFNSLFAFFDQGEMLDKDHPHSGYTPWLFGDDVGRVGRRNEMPGGQSLGATGDE